MVFMEPSRTLPWWIPSGSANETSLLLPAELASKPRALMAALRNNLYRAPEMRAAMARVATSTTFSLSEMAEEDHLAVGPDAFDVVLWGLSGAPDT